MQDQFRPDGQQFIGREITNTLSRVVDLVPEGNSVTVEGTPMYAGEPWGSTHEFGTNLVLPALTDKLEDRYSSVSHIALIDDFTTDNYVDPSYFTLQMRQRPTRVFYESEFQSEAEENLLRLQGEGKTLYIGGEVLLSEHKQPVLRVRSGRVSCELLDACFQRSKGGGIHIIIHPSEFTHQQENMRTILRAICGGRLPSDFINIYFKSHSLALSKVLFTNSYGRTHQI